jgi:hypothetical protein
LDIRQIFALLVALGTSACTATRSVSILWPSTGTDRAEVQLSGLEPAELADSGSFEELLAVYVDLGAEAPAMAGSYRVHGGTLYFQPSFAWTPNLAYVARSQGTHALVEQKHSFHLEPPKPSTRVTQIFPSAERLPENILRMYVHFSAPMRRGGAYGHVRILDAGGDEVYEPFIPFSQELWNPTSTRLTLLFDPGRIKRGLVPNAKFGAPLQPGRRYTLVIDSDWLDEHGVELTAAVEHPFETVASDREQPDAQAWRLSSPGSGTREGLRIDFPEALDRAQLGRMLTLAGADGALLLGQVEITNHERTWIFTPQEPWSAGYFELLINPLLEDLAGNSFTRPFEVDLATSEPLQSATQLVRRGFVIPGE